MNPRVKVSRNFYADEFFCKCGRKQCNAVPPTQKLIDKAQMLRTHLGIPLIITSGSRCPYWNAKCGGKPHSKHLAGEAADIKCLNSYMRHRLIEAAILFFISGIGIGKTFVHIDVRKAAGRGLWLYSEAKQFASN